MALQLGISNSLKSLAQELITKLQQQKEKNVFKPFLVVTQTTGMESWLKQYLAQEMGIAANIQFLKPNEVIHLLFQNLSGKYHFDTLSINNLSWLIYDVLHQNNFKTRFKKVAEYYNQEGIEGKIKRMALAEKVADLFDQYQIYRSDEMNQWSIGEDWDILQHLPQKYDHQWQKMIWEEVRKKAGKNVYDKTYIGREVIRRLKIPEEVEQLQNRISNIYFFGLSLISKYHFDVIQQAAQYVHIHFLLQNPAPEQYWYEDMTEQTVDFLQRKGIMDNRESSIANPLLVGWSTLTKNTFKLFFQHEEILNHLDIIGERVPQNNSLLHKLQSSIFNNIKEDIHFNKDDFADQSMIINSCYSPIREVEVLYNYLVHTIEKQPEEASISPRDIIVMVTDVDLYAPYIRAVFNNAPYSFNFTIADESFLVTDSVSNALAALLSINREQFTSEKVMHLLDFRAIRKQFKIEDIEFLRQVINRANIRFGFSGKEENESHYVSWEYGLQRIMYGLCMKKDMHHFEYGEGKQSFYPLDLVEGYDMFKVTRLVHFVRQLQYMIEARKTKRTISGWVEYVETNCLHLFIGDAAESQEEDYQALIQQLKKYNQLEGLFKEKIEFEVFRHNFLPHLSKAQKNSHFAGRGITFCSLIPMRSIPFKIVAVLGMGLKKFPRIQQTVSFDLLEKKRKPGDRDLKNNDKQLFMDTLLSAEDQFYISYVGQSVKNNETIPPSSLVDELIDFIATRSYNSDEVREHFVQKHPLQGYSRRYNTTKNLYSYLLAEQERDSPNFLGIEENEPDFDFQEIDLHRFIAFLQTPIKGYYQRVLNIYLKKEDYNLPETEKFQLDHLEKWSIKNDCIKLQEDDFENYIIKGKKIGVLPLKNMGNIVVDDVCEELQPVKEKLSKYTKYEEEEQAISQKIGESTIKGKIGGIYNGEIIRYSLSKSVNKYLLSAYIDYLLLHAEGKPKNIKFIAQDGTTYYLSSSINTEEAKKELKNLLELYKEGHKELLLFDYQFGFNLKILEKEQDQMKIKKKINNYFQPKPRHHIDEYLNKAYQGDVYSTEEAIERFIQKGKYFTAIVERFEVIATNG